ncbi:Tat binding protein 1-interacting protein-domain-containing protein [Aspergillus californicus]
MIQKKGKGEKQATNDASVDGSAMILDYLRGRPYSAIDISANLHNKVTKSYAVKALKDLHQKKEIESRAAGELEETEESGDTVAAGKEEIESLKEQIPSLKEKEKKVQADLNSLNAIPLLSELCSEIERLEAEKESFSARLAKACGEGEAHVSLKEKEAARKDWKFWQAQAIVRARICRDLWRKCSETVPENMTREELWEHLGLEGTLM